MNHHTDSQALQEIKIETRRAVMGGSGDPAGQYIEMAIDHLASTNRLNLSPYLTHPENVLKKSDIVNMTDADRAAALAEYNDSQHLIASSLKPNTHETIRNALSQPALSQPTAPVAMFNEEGCNQEFIDKYTQADVSIKTDGLAPMVQHAIDCCKAWEPAARLIGNVMAGDLALMLEDYYDRISAPVAVVSEDMILAFVSADNHWSDLPEGTRPGRAEYIIRHIQETVGGQCWAVSGRHAQPAPPADDQWPLKACVWKRENEWVLEIEGTINETYMICRHTEPLTTPVEDVPGLPSLYSEPPADMSEDERAIELAASLLYTKFAWLEDRYGGEDHEEYKAFTDMRRAVKTLHDAATRAKSDERVVSVADAKEALVDFEIDLNDEIIISGNITLSPSANTIKTIRALLEAAAKEQS